MPGGREGTGEGFRFHSPAPAFPALFNPWWKGKRTNLEQKGAYIHTRTHKDILFYYYTTYYVLCISIWCKIHFGFWFEASGAISKMKPLTTYWITTTLIINLFSFEERGGGPKKWYGKNAINYFLLKLLFRKCHGFKCHTNIVLVWSGSHICPIDRFWIKTQINIHRSKNQCRRFFMAWDRWAYILLGCKHHLYILYCVIHISR